MEPQPISPWFSWASRQLASTARRLSLVAPSFASPPSMPGVDRTLRRSPDSDDTRVAVRLWGRSIEAIRADMIDGVLAANGLAGGGGDVDRVRAELEAAIPISERSRAA